MDVSSTNSATKLSNLAQVNQLLPTWNEGEVASSGSSPGPPTIKATALTEEAPGYSPTTRDGNPEPNQLGSAASFQQSSRVWRAENPYHPSPLREGDHWKKVYEKAGQFDREFCGGWNNEIDSLLTFAGLFSAVVTAFTVESYKWLQPDPLDTTNRILSNLSTHITGGNVTMLPSFSPSASSRRINTLWFLSLTFSLTAGLVGILCKQWLRHYQQDVSLPYKKALALRQFRYEGMVQWRVMDILGSLPIFLGIGLVLFFVGLIDFLHTLDVKVLIPVALLIGVGFASLVVTTLAPAFQYMVYVTREHWYRRHQPWEDVSSRALFAFKSPQSLTILHLATWVFPLANTRLPNWTSFELLFFSNYPTATTYTKRALTWLDETYSHSLDIVHQICLCLQDMEDQVRVDDVDDNGHYWHGNESTAEAIKSLFDTSHPGVTQVAGPSLRRDIIALRYLTSAAASSDHFIILEHLIRTLNSSRCLVHSSTSFESLFALRPFDTNREKEVIWQRAILFRNLLSEGRWRHSTGIPVEVGNVSKNLELFTDSELDSIFKMLRAWMDQNPQDTGLPSHCWASFASRLGPWHELDEALRRPPVHDFMAFLDSLFQMSEGVKFVCYHRPYTGRLGNLEQELDSFFKVLYAWINRNPQDTESFIHCQTFLTSNNFRRVKRARRYQSFRDFEAFLATQITRSDEMGVS